MYRVQGKPDEVALPLQGGTRRWNLLAHRSSQFSMRTRAHPSRAHSNREQEEEDQTETGCWTPSHSRRIIRRQRERDRIGASNVIGGRGTGGLTVPLQTSSARMWNKGMAGGCGWRLVKKTAESSSNQTTNWYHTVLCVVAGSAAHPPE